MRPVVSRPSRAIGRLRAVALVASLAVGLLAAGASPAAAAPASTARPGQDVPAAPPATALGATKGPGIYAAPTWLPLRRNLDGGEIKNGCTHDSQGSQFGYACSGHHDYWALDLMADQGTPAYAAGRGFATNGTGQAGSSGYGNVVRIDHGDGTISLYAHLSEVLVPAEGAWVDENTVIGLTGSTGTSSAPHLHFEVRKPPSPGATAVAVDPGPLKACVLAHEVSYPQIRGYDSWDHLPWGAFTVFSDGTSCPAAAPEEGIGEALAEALPTGWLVLAATAATAVGSGDAPAL